MLWALVALGFAWWGGAAWYANRLYHRASTPPKEHVEKLAWFECTGCDQTFTAYPKHLKIAVLLHHQLDCTAKDEEAA